MHGTAPKYLGPLVRVADLPVRQALRSASTNRLVVPPYKLSTIGSRAFPVAGPHLWNSLTEETTSASSLLTFRKRLKTISLGNLFHILTSFIDFILCLFFIVDLALTCILRPLYKLLSEFN